MNKTLSALLAAIATVSSVKAQGLLSIGRTHDFDNKLPFSVAVASSVGWDSNMNGSSGNSHGSSYMVNGLTANVPVFHDQTNWLNIGLHYSNIWYFDPAPGMDDVYHNGRINVDFQKSLTQRLSVSNNAYISYEAQPDYFVGASVNRTLTQYLYGYNNLAVSYQWNSRLKTVSSYTLSGIQYEDLVGNDSLSHLFGHQFRYSLNRTTTATLDYRFSTTGLDLADSQSHFAMLGADHSFSSALAGSIRVGAQFRSADYEDGSSTSATEPYAEASLNYNLNKRVSLRWFHYLGYDESQMSGAGNAYSYRTGLSGSYQFNDRLSGNLGVNYIHYTADSAGLSDGLDEDTYALQVGFDYRLWRNVSLNGGYSLSTVNSSNSGREFNRHLVTLGVTATF